MVTSHSPAYYMLKAVSRCNTWIKYSGCSLFLFFSLVSDSQQIEEKVDQIENVKRGNILMSHHTITQEVSFYSQQIKGETD
jgi:hypothetical protein